MQKAQADSRQAPLLRELPLRASSYLYVDTSEVEFRAPFVDSAGMLAALPGPMPKACAIHAVLVLLTGFLFAPSPTRAQEFVRVQGTQFQVGNENFRFVGANAAIMHGPLAREGYEATLDAIASDGLRVVRIWAFGDAAAEAPAWQDSYAFRRGPDGYIETSFVHLDRVLAAARARDLKVIVVLGNRWGDYGGAREQLRWAGTSISDDDPDGTTLSAYWSDERCRRAYLDHVARVVSRTNSVTGVPYSEDPTIFAWELINEASAATSASVESLVAWMAAASAFVHARDSHHLVSAGVIGYRTLHERAVWQRVQALASIDFCDAHAYPETDPRIRTPRALRDFVDDHVDIARLFLQKPIIWGEFGYRLDNRQQPADALNHAFLSRAFDAGSAGALVWIYAPPGVVRDGHAIEIGARESRIQTRLRRTLREAARRFATTSPAAFVADEGRAPRGRRFRERVVVRGTGALSSAWERSDSTCRLDIHPGAFTRARFEGAGRIDSAEGMQLWGAGEGTVEYRFTAPVRRAPRELAFDLRVSSELPGRGIGATDADISNVRVAIDGQDVGTFVAPPDNGIGHDVRFVVSDTDLLTRLFAHAPPVHTLRFSTEALPGAGGVCVYHSTAAEAPPGLRITWTLEPSNAPAARQTPLLQAEAPPPGTPQ